MSIGLSSESTIHVSCENDFSQDCCVMVYVPGSPYLSPQKMPGTFTRLRWYIYVCYSL